MTRRGPLLLALLVLPLLGLDRPPGLSDVNEVRHWSYPDFTRVVVELARPVLDKPHVELLGADAAAGRPERLYLDLEGVWVGRDYVDGIAVGDGLLQGVRLRQNTLQKSRLVLDLERYGHHRLLVLSHPPRVVVDVYGKREDPRAGGAGGERSTARLPIDLRPVQTIVLDPGHGGRDPGAIGVDKLREKDVTLRLARLLGRQLADRGFRVVYTRSDDRSITLEERTAIAESVAGDLFISLHANASRRRSVHGVETYYLDENHERHSLNLAARENGIAATEVNELQRTLAKLHMEETMPFSRRLAELVQRQMVDGFARRQRPQDLGVKKGPFYVLFLSNMPAILVEAGFLTNRREAKRLRDPVYVGRLAKQIALGLEHYRDSGDTVAFRSAL